MGIWMHGLMMMMWHDGGFGLQEQQILLKSVDRLGLMSYLILQARIVSTQLIQPLQILLLLR